MSWIDGLIDKIVPHICLGCGAEGDLLCPVCREKLQLSTPNCFRCRQLSPVWSTCAACQEHTALQSVIPATIYDGHAKDIIWRLKSNGAQSAAKTMATIMVESLQSSLALTKNSLLIPIPTASSRVRQRGYDQTNLLTRQLARQLRVAWAPCLVRSGQAHQVGASKEARQAQLRDAYWLQRPKLISACDIILVDDVVTTGASLEAATRVVETASPRTVRAVTFAQPIKRY
jgi:ComF family protein